MPSDNIEKLYKILDILEQSGKDKGKIEEIRKLIDLGNLQEALDKIRILNNEGNISKSGTSNPKKKRKIVKTDNIEKKDEKEENDSKEEIRKENLENESVEKELEVDASDELDEDIDEDDKDKEENLEEI